MGKIAWGVDPIKEMVLLYTSHAELGLTEDEFKTVINDANTAFRDLLAVKLANKSIGRRVGEEVKRKLER